MIPVAAQPEPEGFCEAVRLPGLCALARQVGLASPVPRKGRPVEPVLPAGEVERVRGLAPDALRAALPGLIAAIPASALKPYWSASADALYAAFDGICAYLGLYIWRGTGLSTVDHFVPKAHDKLAAYEWSNYRLSAHLVNCCKGTGAHLDPFVIRDGWFALNLVTCTVEVGPEAGERRGEVVETIATLDLNRAAFVSDRARYVEWAREPGLLGMVREMAPFVYREVVRQGFVAAP